MTTRGTKRKTVFLCLLKKKKGKERKEGKEGGKETIWRGRRRGEKRRRRKREWGREKVE